MLHTQHLRCNPGRMQCCILNVAYSMLQPRTDATLHPQHLRCRGAHDSHQVQGGQTIPIRCRGAYNSHNSHQLLGGTQLQQFLSDAGGIQYPQFPAGAGGHTMPMMQRPIGEHPSDPLSIKQAGISCRSQICIAQFQHRNECTTALVHKHIVHHYNEHTPGCIPPSCTYRR